MSWIRSSDGALLGFVLVLSVLAVGTAAAYSISGTGPSSAEVGSSVTLNATIQEPFSGDDPNEWTVVGTTELEDANWNIETENVGQENGGTVGQGEQVSYQLSDQNATTAVRVEVTGTVPSIGSYSYADQATVVGLSVEQEVDGTVQQTDSWSVDRYTEASRNAREAIDAAIDAGARDAGDDAETALEDAIAFYNSANFERAQDKAEDAQNFAEEANSGPSMLLIGGAVVLLLMVVGAVVYVYRSNRSEGYKLQ